MGLWCVKDGKSEKIDNAMLEMKKSFDRSISHDKLCDMHRRNRQLTRTIRPNCHECSNTYDNFLLSIFYTLGVKINKYFNSETFFTLFTRKYSREWSTLAATKRCADWALGSFYKLTKRRPLTNNISETRFPNILQLVDSQIFNFCSPLEDENAFSEKFFFQNKKLAHWTLSSRVDKTLQKASQLSQTFRR